MSELDRELLNDIGLSEGDQIEDNESEQDEGSEEVQDDESEELTDENEDIDENHNELEENLNEIEDNDDNEDDLQEEVQKSNQIKGSMKALSEMGKEKMIKKVEEYNLKQKQKGVCYLSRIPPYMKANYVRKLLESYGVERIYLAAEDDRKRKFRVRNGGNKKRCYTEGWVEFTDKRVAKRVALSLNCTKMGIYPFPKISFLLEQMNNIKTRSFYGEDLWNIKYLPKFKWENLTERLVYQNRVRKEKLQNELAISKKEQDFYRKQLDQSKKIKAVEQRKSEKNQPKAENISRRTFLQRAPAKKIHNAQSEEIPAETEE